MKNNQFAQKKKTVFCQPARNKWSIDNLKTSEKDGALVLAQPGVEKPKVSEGDENKQSILLEVFVSKGETVARTDEPRIEDVLTKEPQPRIEDVPTKEPELRIEKGLTKGLEVVPQEAKKDVLRDDPNKRGSKGEPRIEDAPDSYLRTQTRRSRCFGTRCKGRISDRGRTRCKG